MVELPGGEGALAGEGRYTGGATARNQPNNKHTPEATKLVARKGPRGG